MPATQFDRDTMARWYAKQHLEVDPGLRAVYYLPTGAPEREIRFVEVNEMIAERRDDGLEPVDFGVGMESDTAHRLLVLDVTPEQWDRLQASTLALPSGWSLEGAVAYEPAGR